MRWLIFGDVHGNLPALESLLENEKGAYDLAICHGDIVNYGPWSNECVQLLNSMDSVVCLQGNHEVGFINGAYPGDHPIAQAFFDKCYPEFTEIATIRRYTEAYQAGKYIIQHTVKDQYIFSDTLVEDLKSSYIIGHSHQQYKRIIGKYELINSGSLGQNRSFINVAEYLIYDHERSIIELKSFIYNIDLVINEMQNRGYSELCLNYYRFKKRHE